MRSRTRSTSRGWYSTQSCRRRASTPPTSQPCRQPRGCSARRAPSSTVDSIRLARCRHDRPHPARRPRAVRCIGGRERWVPVVRRRARRAARRGSRGPRTAEPVLRGGPPGRRRARSDPEPGPARVGAVRQACPAVGSGVVLGSANPHRDRAVAHLMRGEAYPDRATALGNGLAVGCEQWPATTPRVCPPATCRGICLGCRCCSSPASASVDAACVGPGGGREGPGGTPRRRAARGALGAVAQDERQCARGAWAVPSRLTREQRRTQQAPSIPFDVRPACREEGRTRRSAGRPFDELPASRRHRRGPHQSRRRSHRRQSRHRSRRACSPSPARAAARPAAATTPATTTVVIGPRDRRTRGGGRGPGRRRRRPGPGAPGTAFGFVAFPRAPPPRPAPFVLDAARRSSSPAQSSIPDPAGVGASPIESREIALAANPTPTASARPAMPSSSSFLMSPPSSSCASRRGTARSPRSGSRTSARAPRGSRLASEASPPHLRASASTTARPRPVPSVPVLPLPR